MIQGCWRRRAQTSTRLASLSSLSDAFANVTIATRASHKLETEKKLVEAEAQAQQAEEAAAARHRVLRRRWAALRTCLREVKQRMQAIVQLQCLARSHRARATLVVRRQLMTARLRSIPDDVAHSTAVQLQTRLRVHQASATRLADLYEQRCAWYADGRFVPLVTAVASQIVRDLPRASVARQHAQHAVRQLGTEVTDAHISDARCRVAAMEAKVRAPRSPNVHLIGARRACGAALLFHERLCPLTARPCHVGGKCLVPERKRDGPRCRASMPRVA